MAKLDIIEKEIERRKQAIANFEQAEVDIELAIEQFNQLDQFYKDQINTSRTDLECWYLEYRHYTGNWPLVYSNADIETRPYFKDTDAQCNPYFPISKVQDGTFDGISPLSASRDRTGAWARVQAYNDESVTRLPALTELQNFPDISGEPLPVGWPGPQQFECNGETPEGSGVDQPTCLANGGTWDPIPDPVWNGPDTAPALLRTALNTWRANLVQIIADLCNDDGTEEAFYQAIIDDIDIVLPAVASDAVFVRATGNGDPAAWGQTQPFPAGPIEDARARLEIAADTGVAAHIPARLTTITTKADIEEKLFYGLIKLRLHQANGSYSKLETAKGQQNLNGDLIADNEESIATLNLMKVKNS